MTERLKPVEQMINKVMKKKELNERAAIEYMLTVATGRLAALWRYDDSLPEGKKTKGVMVAGKRKRAEKTAKIAPVGTAEKPAKLAKRKAAKRKAGKSKAAGKPAESEAATAA